ncbi:RIP metalloprotease RseP [Clostridium sp. 19966]|uniref:RIP metalloprotease RseP n=1 Tax=Clostridium sp. 19966 TaxID=2768166 RepID=UPI0028E08C23|nr:RIP metalloprotease RseP [Clostridium sp. 19966]MDT8716425.1 RIP metalloprotease RseP [Clostridium sp. 19966]
MYIILAILSLSVLILCHEFGHFLLAKINGVKVEEFSLGMGPKIVGIKGKETEYLIKAFPIGGYVKMLGDDEQTDDPRAMSNKSPLRRLSIVAAGPLMNIILAVVFVMIIAYGKGFIKPIISNVMSSSPAQAANIQKGDVIVQANSKKIVLWEDFSLAVSNNNGSPIKLVVKRQDKEIPITVTPTFDKDMNRYIIGIEGTQVKNPTVSEAIVYGFQESKYIIRETLSAFKNIKASDVGGPVTIVKVSSEAAQSGIYNLMLICAFISIQLAIFNIIPFPALDGGWIFMLLFEIITRKKIPEEKVAIINNVGFAILMLLMVVVIFKDIFYPINF